jgi:hypothetical protein
VSGIKTILPTYEGIFFKKICIGVRTHDMCLFDLFTIYEYIVISLLFYKLDNLNEQK